MNKIKRTSLSIFFTFVSVLTLSHIFPPLTAFGYGNKVVHPSIAEEAFYVWPKDISHEIYEYLNNPNMGNATCETAHTGSKIMEGAEDEDEYDPIDEICCNTEDEENIKSVLQVILVPGYGFLHHFYQVDLEEPNGLSYPGYGRITLSAHGQAKKYWAKALSNYPINKGLSYWYIGRIAHLLADMSVPAHVLDDPHPPGINGDAYENYVNNNYSTIWNREKTGDLTPIESEWDLHDLFFNLAQQAQYFPSDDSDGEYLYGNKDGIPTDILEDITTEAWPVPDWTWRAPTYFNRFNRIDDSKLPIIADKMLPRAILYTAKLYKLFWDAVHPTSPVLTNDLNGVDPQSVSFKWSESLCENCQNIAYNLEVYRGEQTLFKADEDIGNLLTDKYFNDLSSYNITLEPNTTYSWTVSSVSQHNIADINDDVWSTEVATSEFTTGNDITNQRPVPTFNVFPTTGDTTITFNVNASGSTDPDSDPLEYNWNWGDTEIYTGWSSSTSASHSYSELGTYTVTLDVRDNNGAKNYFAKDIVVERAHVPPDKAVNPIPQNNAQCLPIQTNLIWPDSEGATNYDVYFGMTPTLSSSHYQGNQISTSFEPGVLSYETTYYWRIDSQNAYGTTLGDVWEFTTLPPPAWLGYHYWDFDTDWTEGWTERNATNGGIFNADYWIIDPEPDQASGSGIISADNLTGLHTDDYNTIEVRAAVINHFEPFFKAHLKIGGQFLSPIILDYVSGEQVANSQCIYRGKIPHTGQIEQVRIDFFEGDDVADDRVYIDRVNFLQLQSSSAVVMSGYIRDPGGVGVGGIAISFSGVGTVTSDLAGYYQMGLTSGWSGTVSPSKFLYSFNPSAIDISNVSSSITQDFIATPTVNVQTAVFYAGEGDFNDGVVLNYGSDDYSIIQGASIGSGVSSPDYTTLLRVGQDRIASGEYYIYRASIPFDTSRLPDDAVITRATMYLYGYGHDYSDTDFDIDLVTSNQASPNNLTLEDFDQFGTTSVGSINTAYWQGNNAINRIDVTVSGYESIKKSGTTLFGLRSTQDIEQVAPIGQEFVDFWSAESGTTFIPYIVVEYFGYGMFGDVNADDAVDLADVILTLQILTQTSIQSNITLSSDVNNDQKVGLAEGVYAIQVAGGLIEEPPPPIETVTSAGQVWMDRNLGAARVATSTTDADAFGDLYQWGRGTDGHEKRTSLTTDIQSAEDKPGHGRFIVVDYTNEVKDWRNPSNNNLWQNVYCPNNPCPPGFRVPTKTEMEIEYYAYGSKYHYYAYSSPLKLTLGGKRYGTTPLQDSINRYGHYWTSTTSSGEYSAVRYSFKYDYNSYTGWSEYKYTGLSVRCIQD